MTENNVLNQKSKFKSRTNLLLQFKYILEYWKRSQRCKTDYNVRKKSKVKVIKKTEVNVVKRITMFEKNQK